MHVTSMNLKGEFNSYDIDPWDLRDKENCPVRYEVSCWEAFSIDNMDDGVLAQAIITDVLTMQLEDERAPHWEDLFRFLYGDDYSTLPVWEAEEIFYKRTARVFDMYFSNEVQQFVEIHGEYLSIRPELLQAAMDYVGVWYAGYEIPDGIEAIALNPEFEIAAKERGLNSLLTDLTMDAMANVEFNDTIQ